MPIILKDTLKKIKRLKCILKCILNSILLNFENLNWGVCIWPSFEQWPAALDELSAKWQRGAPGSSSLDESWMKSIKGCLPADLLPSLKMSYKQLSIWNLFDIYLKSFASGRSLAQISTTLLPVVSRKPSENDFRWTQPNGLQVALFHHQIHQSNPREVLSSKTCTEWQTYGTRAYQSGQPMLPL